MLAFLFIAPTLLLWISFVCYVLAVLLHQAASAAMDVKDPENPVETWIEYAKHYWPRLMKQWVCGIALFFLLYDNPTGWGLLNLPEFGTTWYVRIGVAIMLGWCSDWVLEKVFAIWHVDGK